MRILQTLLWVAAAIQVAICAANIYLPGKLKYRESLPGVPLIIRQIFFVHSVYIVGVVGLFAVTTIFFGDELASGRGLGRFLAAAIGFFWLCRVPVQLFYYDSALRRQNPTGDVMFAMAALFLAGAYGWAAIA